MINKPVKQQWYKDIKNKDIKMRKRKTENERHLVPFSHNTYCEIKKLSAKEGFRNIEDWILSKIPDLEKTFCVMCKREIKRDEYVRVDRIGNRTIVYCETCGKRV